MLPLITNKQESLYTLNSIINQCLQGMEVLTKEKYEDQNLQNKSYLIITSYLMIQLNSFLDEWNKHFNTNDQVIKFRKRFKPIIDAIESFEDIKSARNTLFAHNRDSKNGHSNPLLLDKDISYNIPIGLHDLCFVLGLLEILQIELQKEFHDEFQKLEEYRLSSAKIKQVTSRYNSEREVIMAIEKVLQDINTNT